MSLPAPRFTRDGTDAIEKHLEWVCDQVRANVTAILPPAVLEGVLLAGAYGRGEGGVLRGFNDAPCDPLEFVVLVRGQAEKEAGVLQRLLGECAARLTPFASTEVHIRVVSPRALRLQRRVTLATYELVAAHRWIIGDEKILSECEHHKDARQLPVTEAMELLLDRCTELLMARERLQRPDFSIQDAAAVTLQIARAQLALGDVYLIARQQYHFSCVQRSERLQEASMPAWRWHLVGHHVQGAGYLTHPRFVAESRESLLVRHGHVCDLARTLWLWLERRRLNRDFSSVQSYARHTGSKRPDAHPLRNLMANARAFGQAGIFSRWCLRHPCERLLRTMPVLLWGSEELADRWLATSCLSVLEGGAELSTESYKRLWDQVKRAGAA